jgi:hypothetical protein
MAYVVLHLVFLQVEKEKSLQIFILQFVETFRDWGPRPIEQLVDQESGSNGTAVGCCCGHPSEVILILIQEISLIASTIVESKWINIYCVIYLQRLCYFKFIILMFVNLTLHGVTFLPSILCSRNTSNIFLSMGRMLLD